MIHIEHFTFNSFQTSCYLLWDNAGNCAIADPGCSNESELHTLTSFIGSKGLKPVCILLTHCHFDHIYGVSALVEKYGIPVYSGAEEMYTLQTTNPYICKGFGLPMPEDFNMEAVADGCIIEVGELRLEVLETPGHSKGGVCFLERDGKVLVCGDTLFAGAIGRTDHPGGDYDQLMKSIFEKLLMLEGDTRILPGHGPSSDISTERMTNPFLLPFNEPYED
jgi:glyoxylase-like metal-dependent hydrolase (beta-lactamase superfamily II)